jgi:hypothetical protein
MTPLPRRCAFFPLAGGDGAGVRGVLGWPCPPPFRGLAAQALPPSSPWGRSLTAGGGRAARSAGKGAA